MTLKLMLRNRDGPTQMMLKMALKSTMMTWKMIVIEDKDTA